MNIITFTVSTMTYQIPILLTSILIPDYQVVRTKGPQWKVNILVGVRLISL